MTRKVLDCLVGCIGLLYSTAYLMGLRSSIFLEPVIVIVLSVYSLIVVRNNRLLLLVFGLMAWANYSICVYNYFLPDSGDLPRMYSDTSAAHEALNLLLLFLSIAVVLLPGEVRQFGTGTKLFSRKKADEVLLLPLILLLIFICIYAFVRPSGLGQERGSGSPLYEYSTILFIVSLYCAGETQWCRNLILFILAVFALQNIFYGGRIVALQLIFIAFFFVFNEKMSTKMLGILVALGIVFFAGFGGVRTAIWNDGLSAVIQSFLSMSKSAFIWDTAASAWHTSVTFVLYRSVITMHEWLYLLTQWLLSIFIGSSAVSDSSLASVTIVWYPHAYGGVLPIYIWFYFGVIGVVAFACLIGFFVNRINLIPLHVEGHSTVFRDWRRLCLLYIVVTAPRWYLYSPSQLTRGLLLMCSVSGALLLIDYWLCKRHFSNSAEI